MSEHWSFYFEGRKHLLTRGWEGEVAGAPVRFASVLGARGYLARCARDAGTARLLRRVLGIIDPGSRHASDADVWGMLATALHRDNLRLSVLDDVPYALAEGEGEETDAAAPVHVREEELTWIEVRLIDESDQPVPGVGYEIELSDGRTERGATNQEGVIRYPRIPHGACKLTFALDEEAWEPA